MRESKDEIYLHVVWATQNRRPLLIPDVESSVYRCIHNEAKKLNCVVLAIGGMPDHVHLAVKIPTNISAAQLMKQVKGVSSKLASDEFVRGTALLDFFAWQEGYGVFSLSRPHITKVVDYIQNQKRHHADGPLWEDWEQS